MRILVLGGTHFVGRHYVNVASAKGHTVTLFNRGRSDPQAFPDLETLIGDREGNYEALRGRRWDVAVDPSAFLPRVLNMTCGILADAVDRYIFVSSAAVYDTQAANGLMNESSPVLPLTDPANENAHRNANYPQLKIGSEDALRSAMPGRVLVIRPGNIVGPDDPTDRFTYWPRRIAAGGEVLAPAPASRRLRVIDVRDLAEFMLQLTEQAVTGVFNATGEVTSLGDIVNISAEVTGARPELTWVDEDFLTRHGVKDWTELPLWWRKGPREPIVWAVDNSLALSQGLRLRPLRSTIEDTYRWDAARPRPLPVGPVGTRYVVETLTADREHELLDLWRTRSAGRGASHADSGGARA